MTATTALYTLSLHDALPISGSGARHIPGARAPVDSAASRVHRILSSARRVHADIPCTRQQPVRSAEDRKSTRLNSSHANISYAVFCLKKKKKQKKQTSTITQ